MRRYLLYWLCFTGGFLLTCIAPLCPAFSADERVTLQSIQIDPDLEGDILQVRSDRPFAFITYTLTQPDRLIIDPVETDVVSTLEPEGRLSGEVVRGWRVLRPAGGSASAGQVDYLEIELSEPAEHLVEDTAGKLVLRIRSKEQQSFLPATAGEPAPAPVPPSSSTVGSKVWDVRDSLSFGLARNRSARIARQEAELAQMKVREARRALYPVATLKYSWTSGVASNVNFREYTTGLQMEQPLYYSGRLMQAYRQSLINLQVSEKRQAKVKSDYSQELAQEYYQYIGAKSSRAAQEGLLAEAENFLKQAQIRFDKGLLTRLEVLNIESQLNQTKFQRANADNDVELARLKFLQKMGLEGRTPSVEVPETFEEPLLQPVDLEEAVHLALRNKPDILVNTLLVKFHEYEERIAIAKTKFKIDLSGFFGTSAAAFDTEPLDAGDDYFVGLKATHNWGPNSTTGSVTKTKTSPRLGQTTRTESTVYSTEMGFIDQLASLSEIKQAQVNLNKARRDLEDAKNSSIQEVQEAHISYQKARLQLGYAQQKIVFREEQVKILKTQASVNEALPSQVLEAVMRLTEERAGKAQALSNYYVALAKLNKAVGLSGHYK